MASVKTSARGLRLGKELWGNLEKFAKEERRRLNEYLTIIIEKHIAEKLKNKSNAPK